MNRPRLYYLITLLAGGVLLLLDRLSKLWVLDRLELYESLTPLPTLAPFFRILHTTNTGVAFGLFRDGGALFALIAAVAVVVMLIYSLRMDTRSPLAYLGMGLLVGGASGNLWDRLVYGHVIDFLDFRLSQALSWPTFNVADMGVVVGVFLFMWVIYAEERQGGEVAASPSP
ncbi:MAG: signal peptidase II [Caldilineales bacterium]|nr:signal peptidase II [Caldilineales bacterium]